MNIEQLLAEIALLKTQLAALLASHTAKSMAIYNEAAACLDKHVTIDPTVSPDLGCAEAVSYVLKNAGYNLPVTGIPGTAALWEWIKESRQFAETTTPVPGDIVISPTGTSTINSPHGHVGIQAKYGILSNDSDTGLFAEKYTNITWGNYFHTIEGFPVLYYHAV
jgi:hypothetical protein